MPMTAEEKQAVLQMLDEMDRLADLSANRKQRRKALLVYTIYTFWGAAIVWGCKLVIDFICG